MFLGREVLAQREQVHDFKFEGFLAKAMTFTFYREYEQFYLLEKSENSIVIAQLSVDGTADLFGFGKKYDVLQAIEVYQP